MLKSLISKFSLKSEEQKADEFFNDALEAMNNGEYLDAIKILNQLLKKNLNQKKIINKLIEAREKQAKILISSNDWQAAVAQLLEAKKTTAT